MPLDFAELAPGGGGLGSGALLICGEDTCPVDLAAVLLRFFAAESCGKCVPCRIGTTRALEILKDLADARATMDGLTQVERIARNMQLASLCGLGQAAAVPILTGLRFFRDEFVAHAQERKCPVGVCPMRGEPGATRGQRAAPVAARIKPQGAQRKNDNCHAERSEPLRESLKRAFAPLTATRHLG